MSTRGRKFMWLAIVLGSTVTVGEQLGCLNLRGQLVELMTPEYEPAEASKNGLKPVYDELDAKRKRISISLNPVITGFIQITDVQFVPTAPQQAIVLEKGGRAAWWDFEKKKSGTWFRRDVRTNSEQGLLGLAFHPDFAKNGRFFINETIRQNGKEVTQIAEMKVDTGKKIPSTKPVFVKSLLTVPQPYPNHNAGQLAFGNDGYLYIGMGDGGWADDPHGNGQKTNTLLGTMLRIDINDTGKRPYRIPNTNPFVKDENYRPEIWAIGLRNPWRYSFDPQGRLIVADVGQNLFEEITILSSGANAGWKIREAAHCFDPKEKCRTAGLVDPIYEYGRTDGGSITGGFVATGNHVPELEGRYIFGDFLSGRLWAIDLPKGTEAIKSAYTLGRWNFLPSTFARDEQGRIYVAGYRSGTVYRIDPS